MVDLSAGTIFAGHRIEGVAGEGGMGVVYRATHMTLEIPVAIKVIRPELAQDAGFRERFKRESRLAASVEHPNVLPVRHAGEEDDLLYITMRFVDGTDLRARLDQRGRLDPESAVDLLTQVAAALDAAHARGLVHRDVKPANVLIEKRGDGDHAFLTDFGLTRQASSQSGLTRAGQWVGTLDYVAPEQIEGKRVDARTDIYALGCMLYEVLTGEVPFFRDTEVATIYAHLNEDPPAMGRHGPVGGVALEAVTTRAMAKDPNQRYQSAGEFGQAALAATAGMRAQTKVSPLKGDTRASAPPIPNVTDTAATESSKTEASSPTVPAGPSASPTRAAAASPPAPPASSVTADVTGKGGRRRGRLIAVAGLVVVVIVAAALAIAGVFAGGGDDTTTQREADARAVMNEFDRAFKAEGQAGIEALLASDARYLYPGFPPDKPQEEYRNLFATREVRDYRLAISSVDPDGDAMVVKAIYEYQDGPSGDSFSGTLTVRLVPDPATGDLKVSTIQPVPDLYIYIDNTDPPANVSATVRIGSREISQEDFKLVQKARNIPGRLPIETGAETAFNSAVKPRVSVDFRDSAGTSHEEYNVGYPFAS